MTVQGQSAPIAQIAFGRTGRGEPVRVTVILPVSIAIPVVPRLLAEKDDKAPLQMPWQRCLPAGCIAGGPISDDQLKRLAARTEAGGIGFREASERDVVLPLSFRGLAQALAAYAKEP